MSGDPTDLIREADLVHVAGYGHPPNGGPAEKFCKRCQSTWPCEARRLRIALGVAVTVGELAEAERDTARAEVRVLTGRVEQERSRAFHLRAALAEANATIERVEARVERLREDYASELAATDPDTNWALGVKHAVQLIARELRGGQQ